ncbi:MAG: DHH family phosphoesterase [Clostridia bacterium]|nr:DHH family phosphoesterase [Clostridia bacterium]
MSKIKFNEIFVPKYRTYLIIILIILIAVCVIIPQLIPINILIYVAVLVFTYKKQASMKEKVVKHINSLMNKLNADDSILNFPIPATIVTNQGDILWNNDGLDNLFKGINKQKYIENIIKEMNEEFDDKFVSIDKEISIHDKHYRLLGNLVNIRKKGSKESVMMLYFIDRTDYYRLFRMYEDAKDCVGLILIDNYDELMQGVTDTDKPQIMAVVERQLREWFAFTGGVFTRLDRNRFLIVFEKKFIKAFTDSKFEILDSIKDITYSNKIPVTLSIGIISEDTTKAEMFQNALAAIDVALGRGGDQAVIRRNGEYEFFGGKSKEIEKRTKVKARVVAQAMQELISESKNVVIMGHKNMDADSLGSAIGVYRIAKAMNKDAYIVYNDYGVGVEGLVRKLGKTYEDVLLPTENIYTKMSEDTLLVIVDTHRKDYVESPEIVDKTNKIVIIDHHRKSTDAIEDALLTFQEVYASSASELVTEMLQYVDEKIELPLVEAECLYAGILTDTKNFMYKTGVRTFEAAAHLKKIGVDVAAIKKMFQNDVDTYIAIADVIRNSEIVFNNIAIAVCSNEVENQMQIAAQAADELLNLNGVETSFVLVDMKDYINISGRSNGSLNVQVVLEKLGGGGHMMIAGAQVQKMTIEETKKQLIKAIEEVREESV